MNDRCPLHAVEVTRSTNQVSIGNDAFKLTCETFRKFCGKIRELGGIPFTDIQSIIPSNDFALAHPTGELGMKNSGTTVAQL